MDGGGDKEAGKTEDGRKERRKGRMKSRRKKKPQSKVIRTTNI